jgi:hypothetical protein
VTIGKHSYWSKKDFEMVAENDKNKQMMTFYHKSSFTFVTDKQNLTQEAFM